MVALLSDMCMGDDSDGDAAPQDDISGLSVTELILNSAGIKLQKSNFYSQQQKYLF